MSSNVGHIRDIVDASVALRNGIEETPGLALLGDAVLNIVAFTAVETPELVPKLNRRLREDGWSLKETKNPPAIQICLTSPMTVRVHELMESIKYHYISINDDLTVTTSSLLEKRMKLTDQANGPPRTSSPRAITHAYLDSEQEYTHIPVFKRFPNDTLAKLFANVCGR